MDRTPRQPLRLPNAESGQEGDERAAVVLQQFNLGRRFCEVYGNRHLPMGGEFRNRDESPEVIAVGRVWAQTGPTRGTRIPTQRTLYRIRRGRLRPLQRQPEEFMENYRPKRSCAECG